MDRTFEIYNMKKSMIISEIDVPKYSEEIIRYDIHEHMVCIVNKLKEIMCVITSISPTNLSVHFM